MALQSFIISLGAFRDDENQGANYIADQVIYIKSKTGSLANIYRDIGGTSQIIQDGFSNITDEKGQFLFYVEAGQYNAEYNGELTPITVTGADFFNNEIASAVEQITIDTMSSRGFVVVGDFASGFTYDNYNQVGIDADGNSWIYVGAGAPNKVVTAGTVPSAGAGYEKVTYGTASSVFTDSGHSVQDELNELKSFDNIVKFNSLFALKSGSAKLSDGDLIVTNGYATAGDSGGAEYIYTTTPPSITDEIFNHTYDQGFLVLKIKNRKFNLYQGGLSPNNADNAPIINAGVSLARALSVSFDVGFNGLGVERVIPEFKIGAEIDLTNYFGDIDFGHIKLTPTGAFRAINTKAIFFKLKNVEVDYKLVTPSEMIAWGGIAIEINGGLPKTSTSEVVFSLYDNIIVRNCFRGIGLNSTDLTLDAGLVWQTTFRRISVYAPLDYAIYINSVVQTSTTIKFDNCHVFGDLATSKGYHVYNSSTVVFDNCSLDGCTNDMDGSVMYVLSQHCNINTFHLESHKMTKNDGKSMLLQANTTIDNMFLYGLELLMVDPSHQSTLIGSESAGFYINLGMVENQAQLAGGTGSVKWLDCADYSAVDLGVKVTPVETLNYDTSRDRSFFDIKKGSCTISKASQSSTTQYLKIFSKTLPSAGFYYESDQITVSTSRGALNGGQSMHSFTRSLFQENLTILPTIIKGYSTDPTRIAMTYDSGSRLLELWVKTIGLAERVGVDVSVTEPSDIGNYGDFGFASTITVESKPGFAALV